MDTERSMPRLVAAAVAAVFLITVLVPGSALLPVVSQAAEVEVAAAGTTVVDELAGGFTPKGSGWRSGDRGYAGHHYWTQTSRRRSLVGIWRATLEKAGRYRVLVRVPWPDATSRKAVYQIKTADGWAKRVRNQRSHRGKWMSLGIHALAKQAEVRLTNKTLDPRRPRRRLAFDAVKFVAVDAPSPTPSPTPSPSPSPTPSPSPSPSPSPTPSP